MRDSPFIQMTQMSTKGHGPGLFKDPPNSAQCGLWERNMRWRLRALRGKTITTKLTAGWDLVAFVHFYHVLICFMIVFLSL